MVEYWRDSLEERYQKWKRKSHDYRNRHNKWKNRTRAERQRINNLNQQLFALQNNIHQNRNNNIMAMYNLPTFHGRPGEDPAEFVRKFYRCCVALGLNPGADNQTRVRIRGIFESCMKDNAKDWFDSSIKGMNWELQNIGDNTNLADLNAIRTLTNNGIRAINAGQFRGRARAIRDNAPANGNALAQPLVPLPTVFDEDWSIAGGRPTDLPPTAPQANAGGNYVAPEMKVGQEIYVLVTDFPTINAQKSKYYFNAVTQGNDSVSRFYSRLRNLVKQAYPNYPDAEREEFVRERFLGGLNPENKVEVSRVGVDNPISILLPRLEKIEMDKGYLLGGYNPNPTTTFQSQPAPSGYTLADIGRIVEEKMNIPKSTPMEQSDSNREIKEKMAQLKQLFTKAMQTWSKPPGPARKKADRIRVENHLDSVDNDNGNPEDGWDVDAIASLVEQMKDLQINQIQTRKAINAVAKKITKHCSKCGRTGHNSRRCPKKKRKRSSKRNKKGKVNITRIEDSSSESDSDSGSEGSDSSDSGTDSASESGSDSEVQI